MKKWKALGFFLFGIALVFGAFSSWFYVWINRPNWEYKRVLDQLENEEQVREFFDEAPDVFYPGHHNYYNKNYSYKERDITGKVLVYFIKIRKESVGRSILYIYIASDGRVEEFFIGGT